MRKLIAAMVIASAGLCAQKKNFDVKYHGQTNARGMNVEVRFLPPFQKIYEMRLVRSGKSLAKKGFCLLFASPSPSLSPFPQILQLRAPILLYAMQDDNHTPQLGRIAWWPEAHFYAQCFLWDWRNSEILFSKVAEVRTWDSKK